MKNQITKRGILLALITIFGIFAALGCAQNKETDMISTESEADASIESLGENSEIDEEKNAEMISAETDTSVEASDVEDESYAIDMLWEALGKLAEDGAIPTFEDNTLIFDGEVFASEETEDTYTQPLSLVGSKVIVGSFDTLFDRNGDTELPPYYPGWSNGSVLEQVCSPSSFADTFSECDYFIFYDGVEYSRNEGYYNNGNIDRVTTVTIVVVVDAHSREVIRLYPIAIDTPSSVITDHTTGYTQCTEAELFIAGMLRDPEQEDFSDRELSELLDSIDDPQAYVIFDMNSDHLDEVLVLYQGEEDEESRYHIYRYLPNYHTGQACFEEVGPALQPNVKSFSCSDEKDGIIAEYEGTFLLYSLGGAFEVYSDAVSLLSEIDELDTQPVEWIDIIE